MTKKKEKPVPPPPPIKKRVVVKKRRRVKRSKKVAIPWEKLEIDIYGSRVAIEGELNIKQELFARCYAQNTAMFGNATMSYAYAYGYKLDEMSHEKGEATNWDKKGTAIAWEDSEYVKACAICAVEGSRHLRNPKINRRIDELLSEYMTDQMVDAELAKVIKQDHDLSPKVAAIREFNALRGRIREKVDHTHLLIGVVKHVYDIANELEDDDD